MSLRRWIVVGCMILGTFGVLLGTSRSAKSATPPLPVPRDVSELHLQMPGDKLVIREDNSLCYSLYADGQERHGEIKGADFLALRKAGKEEVINKIYLDHIRREINSLNSVLAANQSLPLDGSEAFAQKMCLDCGGGCGYYTLPGCLDNSVYPPVCYWTCSAICGACNVTIYSCYGQPHC